MNQIKILALLGFAVLAMALAGCGNGEQTPSPGEDVTHGKSSAPAADTGTKTAH